MPKEVTYEWVAEEVDQDGDIIDCHYFEETEYVRAKAKAEEEPQQGGDHYDFGLCRKVGDDIDGEIERQYAYRDEKGGWPLELDGGTPIPKRLRKYIEG